MEKIKVIKITTSDDITIINIDNEITALQNEVGGYIEPIYLPNDYIMIIDEEGKIKEKDVNYLATDILKYAFDTPDFIVGDCFICKRDNNDIRGLTYKEIKEFFDYYELFKVEVNK